MLKLKRSTWLLIGMAALVVLSGCIVKTTENLTGQQSPTHLREKIKEPERGIILGKEAVIKGNYQEIELNINTTGFSPDIIIAKRNITLRINAHAELDAGCADGIVFPEFNITKIVPKGGSESIEILPAQEGTFDFRCETEMFSGRLIVAN